MARELHADQERTPTAFQPGPRDLYTRAREHFTRREEQLLRDEALSEKLLDGMRQERRRPPPSPPQLSVHLVASEHENARGRFVLDNPTGVGQALSFRPSELRGPSGDRWVPVRFDPARLVLGPNSRATVEVEVAATDGLLAGQRAELDVEVQRDGRVVAVVWVTIDVVAAPS